MEREESPMRARPQPEQAAGHDLEEVLLGGTRKLDSHNLAAQAGVDEADVRAYWQALGIPLVGYDQEAFTDLDVRALTEIFQVARDFGFNERTLTTLIRSTGHTTERLVLWQMEALVEQMAKRFNLDDTSARLRVLDQLPQLAPVLETQLVHAWRRQLAALAARVAVEFSHTDAVVDTRELPLSRAVGFADIVSFTKLTSRLAASELAEFVQQFEDRARDIVTEGGGRVVKTIGDAVLFVADDVVSGARVAIGLAEAAGSVDVGGVKPPGSMASGYVPPGVSAAGGGTSATDLPSAANADPRAVADRLAPVDSPEAPDVPVVRVGLVWGRVLSRFGDIFGPSVNLAARLTDIADPASVYVDRRTAAMLAGDPSFALTAQPERDVRGVGLVQPVRLQWAYRG